MKRTVGISTKFHQLNRETFALYAQNGIGAFELSVKGELYDRLDLKQIVHDAAAFGIKPWSFHLPFAPFEQVNPASLDEALRQKTVEYQSDWLKKAAANGFGHAVIHASGEPIAPDDRPAAMKQAQTSLYALATVAEGEGITLAVEDLPRTCLGHNSREILDLISVHPALRVCFDSNHLLEEDNLAFLEAVRHRLVTVHISDFDFCNERHWLPGEGKIDWVALMNKLDAIDYTGVWMYEVDFACPTIKRAYGLTPDIFRRNADELEARTALTPHGTHYKKLGMWAPEEDE